MVQVQHGTDFVECWKRVEENFGMIRKDFAFTSKKKKILHTFSNRQTLIMHNCNQTKTCFVLCFNAKTIDGNA